MAYSVETAPPSTPGAALRADLEELEKLLVKVNDTTIERTLTLLDQAYLQLAALRDQGVDVKAEEGLWAGFEVRLQDTAGEFVRAARAQGGLAALRQLHAQTDGLWWHVDDLYRTQNRRSLFKALRWLGVIAGLGLVIWFVLTFVIPPDATTVLLTDITYDLEKYIDTQDFTTARALVEDGLVRTDNAVELLVWASVIAEREGDTAAAATYWDQALAADVPPDRLWVARGNNRFRAGDLDGAECAALTTLELEETNAQAHFLIASIAETRGEIDRAIDYFNSTYDLAERNQPQLAVIARVRMGNMLQSPGSLTAPAAEDDAPERTLICP